jgi:hypothetical protein
MSAKQVAEKARAVGLPAALIKLIEKADLPPPAKAEPIAPSPPLPEPIAGYDYVRRHGLEPKRVQAILASLEGRPIEAGLLAWDVLSGSLVGDKALLDELRSTAKRIREITPPAGESCVAMRDVDVRELINRVAIPPFEKLKDAQALAAAQTGAIAALEMQLTIDKDSKTSQAMRAAVPNQARLIHLGHMPTLASFYYHYLWKRLDDREAMAQLVEVQADENADPDLAPTPKQLADGTLEGLELVMYRTGRIGARERVEIEEAGKGLQPEGLDYRKDPPAQLAKTGQRMHLVMAHLGLVHGDLIVPLAVVAEIVKLRPEWRYARQMMAAMTAKLAPLDSNVPLQVVDAFLAQFGNTAELWNDVGDFAPDGAKWIDGLCARLVREIVQQPHDLQAWRAFPRLFLAGKDQDAWSGELDAHVTRQCMIL